MSRPVTSPRRFQPLAAWCGVGLVSLGAGCEKGRDRDAPPMAETPREKPALAIAPAAVKKPPVPVASKEPEPAEQEPPEPRVYAKTRYVWIRGVPDSSVQWIGYLWHGGSVRLRKEEPVLGPGCERWYAVEPRGYVCVDGKRATLDAKDPELLAVARYSPNVDAPSPHRYAESLGVERYRELPTAEFQRLRERDFTAHMAHVESARKGGEVHPSIQGVDVSLTGKDPFGFDSLPKDLQVQRNFVKRTSALAYSAEVDHLGRAFLLSADFTWMPKDRVVPYPEVTFHGVELGGEVNLPIAFFKRGERPQYARGADGRFSESGKTFERLSWVELTGAAEEVDGTEYLQTRSPGVWVAKGDAVVPRPAERTPWGATVGEPDTTLHQPKGRKTWIQVSVLGGFLIAYEGTRPVFTTMTSSGRGGTPVPGKDPVQTASTPVGRFTITGKFITATMEAPNELIHSDVPWTQNFSGPHALHSAYWHNDWGKLKSGGCINVAPVDGKWLFAFTEPRVPTDWHAVRWDPKNEPSTTLVVHK